MDEPITTSGAEPAAPTSPVNADGSFSENWHGKYGAENQATLSRFKNLDDFVNSHVSLRNKYGKNPDSLVEIPTETSSDEVRAAWSKARGIPDTVDAYEYKLSDEMAVKLGQVDDNKMKAVREFAHKELELSPDKFTKLLDFYHTNISNDIDSNEIAFNEQVAAETAANTAKLKKEWLGDYDKKVERAQLVMEKFGGVDAVAELNLQSSPTLIKFLDNIAGAMSEDTLKGLAPSGGVSVTNIKGQIAENREKMETIRKANPVNYRGDPKFKELDERNLELYKQYPIK